MIHTAMGSIPAPADHAERLADSIRMAVLIADECCKAHVQSYGRPIDDGWYSIAPWMGQEPLHTERLAIAAKYLSLRDQLEVDPVDVLRVRVRV